MNSRFRRSAAFILAICLAFCSCSAVTETADRLTEAIGLLTGKADKPDWLVEAEQFDDYAVPIEFYGNYAGDNCLLGKSGVLYERLTDEQKTAYDAMQTAAQTLNPTAFSVGKCTDTDVAIAFNALLCDMPELFWLGSSYGMVRYGGNTYVRFVDDSYGYTCADSVERAEMAQSLTAAVNEFFAQTDISGRSDYECLLEIYNWICKNIVYDSAAADSVGDDSQSEYVHSWSVYGALCNGTAVCSGYSEAFQYMCRLVGVECISVLGDAVDIDGKSEAHQWNAAKIDGKWYYFDPTWDCCDSGALKVSHIYFGMGYDQLLSDHTPYGGPDQLTEDNISFGNFNLFVPTDRADVDYFEQYGIVIKSADEVSTFVNNEALMSGQPVEIKADLGKQLTDSDVKQLVDRFVGMFMSRNSKRTYPTGYRMNFSKIEYGYIGKNVFYMKLYN
ncbi:MAG: transglutaminase domain-containing protein [Firmicutes bacterium]|nr:transglutaminase domain-containing protein [Bacillota bacterium]